jgi:uncharacterized membrane protein
MNVRAWGLAGAVALGVGIALLVFSVATGGASVILLLVVPVFTGNSLAFFVGVLLVFLGFLFLPLLWMADEPEAGSPPRAPQPEPAEVASRSAERDGFGAVVVVGPIPVFFGSWKPGSRRAYLIAALAGAVLFALFLFVVLWLVLRPGG